MTMANTSKISNEQLMDIKNKLGSNVRAWQIKDEIKIQYGIELDESTIRGRFITMGIPLSGTGRVIPTPEPVKIEKTATVPIVQKQYVIPEELKAYIPDPAEFTNYIERPVDKRLAIHYNTGKFPLTQGKQGTGKTFSHQFFAYKHQLPFFLYSCYEDFRLAKLYGDKTIINGTVVFKESLFVKATQNPSVILFDEVNAISNANTFDFHALLQNRELFIKDADNGNGKTYKLHPDCKIGFAINPKSAKYVGGHIKPSNFLGRCTYITYPEFSQAEIRRALQKKFPSLKADDLDKFTTFYFACIQTIERSNIPVDISIRQLNHVVDLWMHGLPLQESIEDGMTSIMEAISQPKAKDSFFRLAQAVWKELMPQSDKEKVKDDGSTFANFIMRMR